MLFQLYIQNDLIVNYGVLRLDVLDAHHIQENQVPLEEEEVQGHAHYDLKVIGEVFIPEYDGEGNQILPTNG